MAGHTPWEAIRARKGATPPPDPARGAALERAMDEALRIARAQEAGATQVAVADAPGGDPDTRRDDLYFAALRGYVEELGGRLVLTAVFPAAATAAATEGDREAPARAVAGAGAVPPE